MIKGKLSSNKGMDAWVHDVDTDLKSIVRHINKGTRFIQATTTQRDALTNLYKGLVIFNLTTLKLNVYNGTSWEQVTSA